MKNLFLTFFLTCILIQMHAQNSIGVHFGFLGTHTSIAEYERIERQDYLLDSMVLKKDVGSALVAVNVDIDLGRNFFLSTGFHYSNKGLSNVIFTDSTGWPWQTPARQHYVGLSMLLGYHLSFKDSKFGMQFATGPHIDFAVGTPNGGALFSGPYYRFFMPFSRFNEIDLSWAAEAGMTYELGPGKMIVKLSYQHGLSDVLEDAFVVARAMSLGFSVGYAFRLTGSVAK